MLKFIKESTMPFFITDGGKAVIYNNKVHVLYGYDHYSWNGNEWHEESTLPIQFIQGNVVVYNNKIHILGSHDDSDHYFSHYSWNGNEWIQEIDLPDYMSTNLSVVYDGKIHLFGGEMGFSNAHYTWAEGENEWNRSELETSGYDMGNAIVYNNLIYLFGGQGQRNKFITYDGNEWSEEKDIGFYYNSGSKLIIYNNKINFMHLYYNGMYCCAEWTENSDINIYCSGDDMSALSGPYIVYNNKINTFGGNISVGDCHYVLENVYNKIVFNGEKLIDLSADTVDQNKILDGYIAHDNTGMQITGTYPVMPVRYNSGNNIIFCNNKIKFLNEHSDDDTNYKTIANINESPVWMHVCKYGTFYGENIGDVIISRTDNYDNEYKIVIAQLDQNYIDSFELLSVNYFDRTHFLIQYRYQTGENTYSKTYVRLVGSATVDDISGRLIISDAIEISEATTSTNEYNGYIVPTDESTSFVIIQTNKTISTGALEISYTKINIDLSSIVINIPQENRWTILAESNIDNFLSPWFYTCSRHCPVIFYDANNNAQKALYVYGYNSTDNIGRGITEDEPMRNLHIIGKKDDGYYVGIDSDGMFRNGQIEDNQLTINARFDTSAYFAAKNSIPIDFNRCCTVVYNGNIHLLGDYSVNNGLSHYVFDGENFTRLPDLPYQFNQACCVVYNNKIHILGSYGYGYYRNHYSYNGSEWTEETELPYNFNKASAVVYDDKIHILGGYQYSNYKSHYSWDGVEWTEETELPYDFYQASAVVYNNKIHILGSYGYGYYRNHYSYNGSEWTEETELPYDFYQASAVVYNNKIYLLGGGDYRSYKNYTYLNNNKWTYDKEGVFLLGNNIIVNKIGQAFQYYKDDNNYSNFSNINLDNSKLNVLYYDTFWYDKCIGPSSDMFQNIYISNYNHE